MVALVTAQRGWIGATLVGLWGGWGAFFCGEAGRHVVAPVLLQASITSRLGHIRWEHSQAGHTHIDPDVGLRGARGRLLAQEEEVAGEELQLSLARLALQDHLRRGNKGINKHQICRVFFIMKGFFFF